MVLVVGLSLPHSTVRVAKGTRISLRISSPGVSKSRTEKSLNSLIYSSLIEIITKFSKQIKSSLTVKDIAGLGR